MAQRSTLAVLILLCITLVYGHTSVISPAPKKPGNNAVGYCGMSPTSIGPGTASPWGTDYNGNPLVHTVIGGTSLTFDYTLLHNFESLQSGHFLASGDYSQFLSGGGQVLVDNVPYTDGAQNTLTLTLPLNEIPQATVSVFSNELGYGNCVDLIVRCPIGKQGNGCNDYNQTALHYLAQLASTDPTAYQNAIAELNDPNLASIKTDVENQVNSINNPASKSGAAVGIAIFVIVFVGIVAGTLYYRHKDPAGFSMKVDAAKESMGNAWIAVKMKFSSGSSSSTLPTTRSNATATVVPARPTPPANNNRPTPPANNRPVPPPKVAAPTPASNMNRSTPPPNANRPAPPPKQGGAKAPPPPTGEIQNADDYKYAPPAKELPSKPNRPTPPPKRTS